MKVFKCDLCGKYYDHYEGEIDDYHVNVIVIGTFDDFSGTKNKKCYDCCQDCMTAFSQFLWERRHPQKKKVLDQEGWRGE